MYHRFKAAALAGLLLGLTGLVLNALPFGAGLEESLGLQLLFHLRGARQGPSSVAVIALDQESSELLGLPSNPLKWPRRVHAQLTETLSSLNVSVVAFDVLFNEPTTETDDELFEEAIKKAGNVVLCEHLRKDVIPVSNIPFALDAIHSERCVPPLKRFSDCAAALAPFPLPKVPNRVSQFWTFKTEAGCKPTLPFLAFQLYVSSSYHQFYRLLESVSPAHSGILPEKLEDISSNRGFGWFAAVVRGMFEENPWIGHEMLRRLHSGEQLAAPAGRARLLHATVKAYMSPDSVFLNFYGPPGTVQTIPLHQVLKPVVPAGLPDLRGKAVFVGLSEINRSDQRDGFNTVFSRSDGRDLSGVEIAATAFANLLEEMPVKPVAGAISVLLAIVWGVALGAICFLLPLPVSAILMVGVLVAYVAVSGTLFDSFGVWMPLAVPFLVQAPLAYCSAFVWLHAHAKRERSEIRKAFGFFLPDKAIDQIVGEMQSSREAPQNRQTVYGAVLCSDGAQYATLSEQLDPVELTAFLNRYYQAIFGPVKANGGSISDIIGDSMLAVWARAHPDIAMRRQACLAAMQIVDASKRFNENSATPLRTRVGLHYGQLLLGTVGGGDHYEYRPVGDVVNTASRIEGLNKHLGTRVLASGETVKGLDGIFMRELGRFLLYGKSNPVQVFQLVCASESATDEQRRWSELFSQALRAFEMRMWDEAEKLFEESLRIAGDDQACRYYLGRCSIYRTNPPGDDWDGIVYFNTK